MSNHAGYLGNRVEFISSRLALVQGRYGPMLANRNDLFMGQSLIVYGESNYFEVLMLERLCIQQGTFVEVGANMGVHTVPIGKYLQPMGRRLIAFEPQSELCAQLSKNLELSHLANVEVVRGACGSDNCQVSFRLPDYDQPGNFGGTEMLSKAQEDCSAFDHVPCFRLDDYLANEEVGVMKVDVEGWELPVLKGAEQVLSRNRPLLYVENDHHQGGTELIEWLWKMGYELWFHNSQLFNPGNYFGSTINLFRNLYSLNLIGIPAESKIRRPLKLKRVVTGTEFKVSRPKNAEAASL
jgi:FkbM family methyltransferase